MFKMFLFLILFFIHDGEKVVEYTFFNSRPFVVIRAVLLQEAVQHALAAGLVNDEVVIPLVIVKTDLNIGPRNYDFGRPRRRQLQHEVAQMLLANGALELGSIVRDAHVLLALVALQANTQLASNAVVRLVIALVVDSAGRVVVDLNQKPSHNIKFLVASDGRPDQGRREVPSFVDE
jgi:hypothetical protein